MNRLTFPPSFRGVRASLLHRRPAPSSVVRLGHVTVIRCSLLWGQTHVHPVVFTVQQNITTCVTILPPVQHENFTPLSLNFFYRAAEYAPCKVSAKVIYLLRDFEHGGLLPRRPVQTTSLRKSRIIVRISCLSCRFARNVGCLLLDNLFSRLGDNKTYFPNSLFYCWFGLEPGRSHQPNNYWSSREQRETRPQVQQAKTIDQRDKLRAQGGGRVCRSV